MVGYGGGFAAVSLCCAHISDRTRALAALAPLAPLAPLAT